MADGGVGEMALLEAAGATEATAAGVSAFEGAGGLAALEGMGGLSALQGASPGVLGSAFPGVSAEVMSGLEAVNPEIYQQLLGAVQNAPTSAQLAAQYGPGTQLASAANTASDVGSVVGDALNRSATTTPFSSAAEKAYAAYPDMGAVGEANAAISAPQVSGNADKAALLSNEGYQGSLLPMPSAAEAPAWESPLKPVYDFYAKQDPLTQGVMKYGGMGLSALGTVKALSKPTSVAAPGRYTGPLSKYSMSSNYQPYVYRPYADGGPVEQMSNQNAVGANTGYPMADMRSPAYATPYQTPISQNVLTGSQDTRVDPYTGEEKLAMGGIASLGGYSDGGQLLRGPGDGVSDSIPATIGSKQPARLADGEFVVPARIVSELGNGSTEAGARQLYAMMDRVQKQRGKTTGKNRVAKDTKAAKYLPA